MKHILALFLMVGCSELSAYERNLDFVNTIESTNKTKNLIYLNCINDKENLRDLGLNETLVLDLDKKLFSSKTHLELDLTENDTYYFASFKGQFKLIEYTLNRISLDLRIINSEIQQRYQCKMVDRI